MLLVSEARPGGLGRMRTAKKAFETLTDDPSSRGDFPSLIVSREVKYSPLATSSEAAGRPLFCDEKNRARALACLISVGASLVELTARDFENAINVVIPVTLPSGQCKTMSIASAIQLWGGEDLAQFGKRFHSLAKLSQEFASLVPKMEKSCLLPLRKGFEDCLRGGAENGGVFGMGQSLTAAVSSWDHEREPRSSRRATVGSLCLDWQRNTCSRACDLAAEGHKCAICGDKGHGALRCRKRRQTPAPRAPRRDGDRRDKDRGRRQNNRSGNGGR